MPMDEEKEVKAVKKVRNPGRPPRLTKQLIEDVTKLIRAGNYIETACAYNNLPKKVYYEWLRKAKETRVEVLETIPPRNMRLYRLFSHSIEKALAESEARDVQTIGIAAAKSWQAAAWRLERKNHERWGQKRQVGMNANVLQGDMSEDTKNRLEKLMDVDKGIDDE